ALHGQHAEAVGDDQRPGAAVADLERGGEGAGRVDVVVDGQVEAQLVQPSAQGGDRGQVLDLRVPHEPAVHASSRRTTSASTSRSASGRRGTPRGVASEVAQPRSSNTMAASWRYAGTGSRNVNWPRYCNRSFSSAKAGSP